MTTIAYPKLVPAPEPDPTSAMQLFHRVDRLIPEDQEILKIPPDMKASEALALMNQGTYSQLPVVEGGSVLGMFSYRSFALGVARMGSSAGKAAELAVEEFIEKPAFARITDDFISIIECFNSTDAVLIGHEDRLQHIVTPIDVLLYLHSVANAFVLLEEIELSLRALIRMAVDDTTLKTCIHNSLGHLYQSDKLPNRLEDMTVHDVVQIVRDGRNWDYFCSFFGKSRERASARLQPLPDLRNDVFHFKREITMEDHQVLANLRDWFLMRIRAAEARRKGDDNV